jgi:hypothetical protein
MKLSITRLSLLAFFVVVVGVCASPTISAKRMTTDCSACPEYDVAIQVYDDHWFGATGGPLAADTLTADGSSPRTFHILDVNGGDLEDGDTIALKVRTSFFGDFFVTTASGSTPIKFYNTYEFDLSDDELFTVETHDCDNCSLSGGGRFSLRSVSTGYYLTAVSGGGGNVDGTASSAGIYEIFELSVF